MVKIPVSMQSCAVPRASAEQPPVEPTDPAGILSAAGGKILDAYRRYEDLKALTSQLNGLADSAPIPAHVEIDEITIRFRVSGESRTAATRTVHRVGDLYRLLSLETEALVNQMRDQALRAREAATTVEEACSRSQYVANAQQNGRMV